MLNLIDLMEKGYQRAKAADGVVLAHLKFG